MKYKTLIGGSIAVALLVTNVQCIHLKQLQRDEDDRFEAQLQEDLDMEAAIDQANINEPSNTPAPKMKEVKVEMKKHESELVNNNDIPPGDKADIQQKTDEPPQLKFKDQEVDDLLKSFSVEKFEKKY